MKWIIDGRMYNTESAKELGYYASGSDRTNFSFYEQWLYQKRNGEFFLHCSGGSLSPYARSIGRDHWAGGDQIIPLSYDMAKEWAEKYLSADNYESIFGKVDEGSFYSICCSLSAEAYRKLKILTSKKSQSMGKIIEQLLEVE